MNYGRLSYHVKKKEEDMCLEQVKEKGEETEKENTNANVREKNKNHTSSIEKTKQGLNLRRHAYVDRS